MDYNEEITIIEDNANNFVAPDDAMGERLDKVLAQLMPGVSRARLQLWIENEAVKVNGKVVTKVRQKVSAGDEIEVVAQPSPEELAFSPVEMDLDIVYEDDTIIVVNKPVGLVLATTMRPDVSRSKRCTIPARGMFFNSGKRKRRPFKSVSSQ